MLQVADDANCTHSCRLLSAMIAKVFKSGTGSTERFRTGRLGIDIGSSSIKMARMKWQSGRWTITNRLLIPVEQPSENLEQDLRGGFLAQPLQVLQNRPLKNSYDCSCVLPMSVTDIRSVEIPQGNADEVRQMATEALRDASPDFDERVTTLWQHSVTPHDLAMVSGISVSNPVGESIVSDLSQVGLRCSEIESLPFALARAAEMTPSGCCTQPIGLLDWGHESVTFVVSYRGRPEFVRTFRDCGSGETLTAVAKGLDMSVEDTRHVLAACGLPKGKSDSSTAAISRTVEQLMIPEMRNIAAELRKTLLYLRHHLSRILPARLMLFGGMAAVPNLDHVFQDLCDIETCPWSLNADNSHHTDPVYAVALATSAREIIR